MPELFFLCFMGFCAGIIVAGGVSGLLIGLSIVPRYAGITHTAECIFLYEDMSLLGTVAGTVIFLFHIPLSLGPWFLALCGVFFGIFLGGWMPFHIVGLDGFNAIMDYIPGFIWFFAKAFFVVFLLMWIKWTFPRLRIDQILNLEWKYLVPISMVNLLLMACCVAFGFHF